MRRGGAVAIACLVAGVLFPGATRPPIRRLQPVTAAAPAGMAQVVALMIQGGGFGHGRGMSQWGAYGWAVNSGWSYPQILAHYYGGTTLGSAPLSSRLRVRLTGLDGSGRVGVISTTGTALWNGQGYVALHAVETSFDNFDIYAAPSPTCPGAGTWTLIDTAVSGPITFATSASELGTPAGEVLGVCQADGSVIHYRGRIEITKDTAAAARVVNDVAIEGYLHGVIPREVAALWGLAGGGRGMNALRAQAVAARSYALAQRRYASVGGYATTCDTSTCQVYGGAAGRDTAGGALRSGGVCEAGNDTFECVTTNQAVSDTAGRVLRWPGGAVVSAEFSASNGPRTAGGAFPAVDDPGDDVPGNPNHRWTRIIDADTVAAWWGLGSLVSAASEADPNLGYSGVWDLRVRLVGTAGTQVVSNADFQRAFALRSPGFAVSPVDREVQSAVGFALIGDSVGLSVSESSTAELRSQLDGVFPAQSYDAVTSRCTTGCIDSGAAAAARVSVGTGVAVVVLGYNDFASAADFGAKIDTVMAALRRRNVGHVGWVTLSDRSPSYGASYRQINQALVDATRRWVELSVIDWHGYSAGSASNRSRWFSSDGIHLTLTGQAAFSRYLRGTVFELTADTPTGRADSLLAIDLSTGGWDTKRFWKLGASATGSGRFNPGATTAVSGDFDTDGRVDDTFHLNRHSGSWMLLGWSNFVPSVRRTGIWSDVWDRLATADFDGDGRVNDLILVDQGGGRWTTISFAAGIPTQRVSGPISSIYDETVVADLDRDGRLDDTVSWDRQSGRWVAHSWTSAGAVARSSGQWSVGWDRLVAADLDGEGIVDEVGLWDAASGRMAVLEFTSMRPVQRSVVSLLVGADLLAAADLDTDGRPDELFVRRGASGVWAVYRWSRFVPTKVRSGTWTPGRDLILPGRFG